MPETQKHTGQINTRDSEIFPRGRLRTFMLWFCIICTFILLLGHVAPFRFFLPHAFSPALGMYSFLTSRAGADMVFVGSSRTRYGIRPAYFRKKLSEAGYDDVRVFNLGMNSTEITSHYFIIRDYLKGARHPDTLFLEVGPRSFNVNSLRKLDAWKYFANLSDIPDLLPRCRYMEDIQAVFSIFYRGFVVAADSTRVEAVKRFVAGYRATHDGEEALIAYKVISRGKSWDRVVKGMTRTLHSKVFNDYQISDEISESLSSIIETCRQRRIKLVLLRFPVSDTYMEIVGKDIESTFNSYLDSILANHDVPYIDISKSGWANERRYFWDPQHPTLKGARRITHEFMKRYVTCCMKDK